MRIISRIRDNRIGSDNVMVECTIGEYVRLARIVIDQNKFQRKRVRSSKTVYSLLKDDLEKGCVIPPLVLSVTLEVPGQFLTDENFLQYLIDNYQHVAILDGLQRSYTLLDLMKDIEHDDVLSDRVKHHHLRLEFYIGINRLGVLYRMLTLNTGQTAMSLRHQIEILYSDYLEEDIDGVRLVTEAGGGGASGAGEYVFKDVIEGLNAYIERNELPIDRADVLENIKSLEKLSKEPRDSDVFKSYVLSWHKFVSVMCDPYDDVVFSPREDFDMDEDSEVPEPWIFARTIKSAFKRSQAMAGFGAAIAHLKDYGLIHGFEHIEEVLGELDGIDALEFLETLNANMDWLRNNVKKIGNAQRAYFQFFFRELFNPQSDSYKNPGLSLQTGFKKYQTQFV